MNDESNIQAEQIVDRAVGALRDAPVPPGPPPETLQAVLAAGGTGAQRAKHKTIRQRIFTMNRLPKIAASILILAGVAALVWVLGPGTATVAWADVQERIRNLHTLTCRIRVERKGQAPFEGRMMFKEPGLIRQEMTKPLQCINIFDLEEGKGLSLISKEKIAVLMDMSDLPQEIRKEHEDKNYLAQIKELVEKSGQELGEKQIGQRRAKGYKVEHEGELFTVWVDAETGDPLEMEMKLFQDQGVLTTSNFEFDKPLDDKLFSLEVPEG
jgi:outer membrane lipoprotein-sorting protein